MSTMPTEHTIDEDSLMPAKAALQCHYVVNLTDGGVGNCQGKSGHEPPHKLWPGLEKARKPHARWRTWKGWGIR